MSSIADIRKDYKLRSLSEHDVAANPIDQFTKWWDEAIASNIDGNGRGFEFLFFIEVRSEIEGRSQAGVLVA